MVNKTGAGPHLLATPDWNREHGVLEADALEKVHPSLQSSRLQTLSTWLHQLDPREPEKWETKTKARQGSPL